MRRRGFLGLLAALPAAGAVIAAPTPPAKSVSPEVAIPAADIDNPNYWRLVRAEVNGNFEGDWLEVQLILKKRDGSGAVCLKEIVTSEQIVNCLGYNPCGCSGTYHSSACSDVNPLFWRDRTRIPVHPRIQDYAVQIAWNRTHPYYVRSARLHDADLLGHALHGDDGCWAALKLPGD